MRLGRVRILARERDVGGEDVRACEMQGVVGRLQQRDRLAHVRQRDRFASFRVCEARHRPVEADAHIRVLGLLHPLERMPHDLLGAREVAHVAERVAEQRRVARLERRVAASAQLVDAALEQLDRSLCASRLGVRLAEVAIDVEAVDRVERLAVERVLDQR